MRRMRDEGNVQKREGKAGICGLLGLAKHQIYAIYDRYSEFQSA